MKIERKDLKDRRRARNAVRKGIRNGRMLDVEIAVVVDAEAEVERVGETFLIACVGAIGRFTVPVSLCALPH